MPNFRQFYSNIKTVACNLATAGANQAAFIDSARWPASTGFIDVSGFDRVCFMVYLAGLADALTFTVKADTSATETANIATVTGAAKTLSASDDGKWISIEFSAADVAALNTSTLSYRYVTLVVSGVSGSNYGVIVCHLWRGSDLAVTQPANYAYGVIVN